MCDFDYQWDTDSFEEILMISQISQRTQNVFLSKVEEEFCDDFYGSRIDCF